MLDGIKMLRFLWIGFWEGSRARSLCRDLEIGADTRARVGALIDWWASDKT